MSTTEFQALIASAFPKTQGYVKTAFRIPFMESQWVGQISRQIHLSTHLWYVVVDSYYTFAGLKPYTNLVIGGVIFHLVETDKNKLLRLWPMVDKWAEKIETTVIKSALYPPSGTQIQRCTDIGQAIATVSAAMRSGHNVTLFTDGGACSETYFEDYTNANLETLVKRLTDLIVLFPVYQDGKGALPEKFLSLEVFDPN